MTANVTGGQPGRPVRQGEYVVEVAAHLGTPVTWGQLAALRSALAPEYGA
jgi:hypothetical protein